MHGSGGLAEFLEIRVAALLPVLRDRHEPASIDAALEAQPTFADAARQRRPAAHGYATVIVPAIVEVEHIRQSRNHTPIEVPALLATRNHVERSPFAAGRIDKGAKAHGPHPPHSAPSCRARPTPANIHFRT